MKVPYYTTTKENVMTMVAIALIVWALLILSSFFFWNIKVNGHEVQSIPARLLIATIAVPLIGLIFWVLGHIFWVFSFIGEFLLSPIFALFQ